jgi:hypothetical protein
MLPALRICLVATVLSSAIACATQRDTGSALVAAGAVTAVVASQASAGRGACIQTGCATQTTKHAAAAAAGVAAGVAIAAVGAALQSAPSTDTAAASPRPTPPPAGNPWRLERKPVPATEEEAPAYYIEE